jgi:hypothetical protein
MGLLEFEIDGLNRHDVPREIPWFIVVYLRNRFE